VQAGFAAVAAADMPGFAAMFASDATWNHRNADRFGGVKHGVDEIGTLRPVPQSYLPDGAGQVAVVTRISATRPDGRSFDDTQILLFQLAEGRVRQVDQFVGDPDAVAAFWD
jgi:ketosteroid isomerase-like protein